MTLGEIIRNEGLTIKMLYEYLISRGIEITLSSLHRYCRASSHSFGRYDVWEAIDAFVIENDIPWDDEW